MQKVGKGVYPFFVRVAMELRRLSTAGAWDGQAFKAALQCVKKQIPADQSQNFYTETLLKQVKQAMTKLFGEETPTKEETPASDKEELVSEQTVDPNWVKKQIQDPENITFVHALKNPKLEEAKVNWMIANGDDKGFPQWPDCMQVPETLTLTLTLTLTVAGLCAGARRDGRVRCPKVKS